MTGPDARRVVFAGPPKAGVSTLINAVVGAAVLPVATAGRPGPPVDVHVVGQQSPTHPTLHLDEEVRGAVLEADRIARTSPLRPWPPGGPSGAERTSHLLSGPLSPAAPDVVTARQVRQVLADVRYVLTGDETTVPLPDGSAWVTVGAPWAVPDRRLILVDGAPTVPRWCDAAVLVLDYSRLGARDQDRAVAWATAMAGRIPPERITVVVNRADQGDDDLSGTDLIRHIRALVPTAAGPVLVTSARWGLVGQRHLGRDIGPELLRGLLFPLGGGTTEPTELDTLARQLVTASGVLPLRSHLVGLR